MNEKGIKAEIVELVCSNGDTFHRSIHSIEPFSQASFVVRDKLLNDKKFLIIPTRCIDRIWMEASDAEAINQPTA